MVDLGRAIRMAVDSGKVKFGERDSIKAALNGNAKVLVLAKNCPKEVREDIMQYAKLSSIPVLEYAGTGKELGAVCGKPFNVSALAIFDAGNSPILNLIQK